MRSTMTDALGFATTRSADVQVPADSDLSGSAPAALPLRGARSAGEHLVEVRRVAAQVAVVPGIQGVANT